MRKKERIPTAASGCGRFFAAAGQMRGTPPAKARLFTGAAGRHIGALVIKGEKTKRYQVHDVLITNKEGAPSFKTESADIGQQGFRDSIPSKSDTTISKRADFVNAAEEALRPLAGPGAEAQSGEEEYMDALGAGGENFRWAE